MATKPTLHPDDLALWGRVYNLAWELNAMFGLDLKVVEPKRRPNGAGGLCYPRERRISILLRHKAYAYDGGKWSKNPEPWKSIARTVAHEMAHLTHENHGKEFKALEAEYIAAIPLTKTHKETLWN